MPFGYRTVPSHGDGMAGMLSTIDKFGRCDDSPRWMCSVTIPVSVIQSL
jgi:hypothetical protein